MEPRILAQSNAMPAPTWNRLGVNKVDIEIPADLSCARSLRIEKGEDLRVDAAAFEQALPAVFEQAATGGLTETIPGSFTRAVPCAFGTGMGDNAYRYLRESAGNSLVFATEAGQKATDAVVVVESIDGATNVAAIDIIAAENSEISLCVDLDSPRDGTGVVGLSLRVFAAAGARVKITSTQSLDDSWIALDDTGLFLDDDAHIDVRHTVLGADKNYIGLAGELLGRKSQVSVDTRYLGSDTRELDFNYMLRHRGKDTHSTMSANGVLADESIKTLRGTIEFVRGCKGASGEESETVLIADERATNRSIPVILCGEDDVSGEHGGTIGHIRPDQLFYLTARGLSEEDCEQLFVRSIFEEALISAPTDTAHTGVLRLGGTSLGSIEAIES